MVFLKSTLKYFFFLFILFLILEILSRFLFSDFNENSIFINIDKNTRISKGIKTHFNQYKDIMVRVPYAKKNIEEKSKKTIWVIGDSVTNGYGVRFHETYYSYLDDLINLNNKKYNIISNSFYGSDFGDVKALVKEKIIDYARPGDVLIYQFHYNDLTDIAKYQIKLDNDKLPFRGKLDYFINKSRNFRYEYLNRSTFIKVLNHHSSILIRNTTGSCEERGTDALGPYTFAYSATGYENESDQSWKKFKEDLLETKEILTTNNIKFVVLIVPISIQIEHHQKLNKLNYDISCGKFDPRQKLINFLKETKVEYADPTEMFKIRSNQFFKEGNPQTLFVQYDTAHPNSIGHYLMGLELFQKINLLDD